MAATPRIGIIGAGNVGTALTQGLSRAGFDVNAVGREPERVRQLARDADVVILAVPFGERMNALREMGDAVDGKVLVDVTNAITPEGEFATSGARSGAEELQENARTAKVVKAFNTVFAPNMSTGKVHGERLTLLYAGDDPQAKATVGRLGRAIGFDPVDAGPLKNARWLEALGMLTISLGYEQGLGPASGIKIIHEPTTGPTGTHEREAARSR